MCYGTKAFISGRACTELKELKSDDENVLFTGDGMHAWCMD